MQDFVAVGDADPLVDEDVLDELIVEEPELELELELDDCRLVELVLEEPDEVEVGGWVLDGVLLEEVLGDAEEEVTVTELLDAGRLFVDEDSGVEVVSGASGMGSVRVAKGLAVEAILQDDGVVVAIVDDEEGVALQPVTTDVLVTQLVLYNGVPELVVVGTGVQETQLSVTVLVVHSAVAVVVVSVAVTVQPLATEVLVVQLSVRIGVPDEVPLVTDVHEAHVFVTVEVDVHDVSVDVG